MKAIREIGMKGIRGPYRQLQCVLVTVGVHPGWQKRIAIKHIRFYTLIAREASYSYGGRRG